MKNNRRQFLKRSFLGGGALLLGAQASIQASTLQEISTKKAAKSNPFKFGIAGYTFVHFDLDATLKLMQRLDMKYLCIKNFHLPYESTDEQIKAFHDKCAAHGVTGYGVGPIYMKTKKEVDDAFVYAKRVGVKTIVGIPEYDMLSYVSQKVAEYDMKYAIHLHGPDIPKFPDATDVWEHTKDLDPRMGMCLDIGHDLRNGCDPVADIMRYHSRIFDMHIKDVTAASKAGKGIEFGRGKIDFVGVIDALRKVNYQGVCSLEYEKDMKDPFVGIAECVGYFKALMQNC